MDYSIITDNLFLRPVEPDDAKEWFPFCQIEEISRYMAWDVHVDLEQTKGVIKELIKKKSNGTAITWSIFYQEKFCGIISIIAIKRCHLSLTYNRGELAYWLGPQFNGKGLMTEAGKAIIRFAFDKMNMERLIVYHDTRNSASEKLIKRMGFSLIGIEHRSHKKNNEWCDTAYYELLKD